MSLQPRLRTDIAAVLQLSAKKNRRSIPMELDNILREHFFCPRIPLVGISHDGTPAGDNTPRTLARELGWRGKIVP